jgi:hypothetical protein
MEMVSNLMITVKRFIEVRFAIRIKIMQDTNLIATAYVDQIVNNFDPLRLKQTAGDTVPDKLSVLT